MRGALKSWFPLMEGDKIIPADAGSTPPRCLPGCGRPDHPRRCGEHEDLWHKVIQPAGSSPQMRGAPQTRVEQPVPSGIIPADAGSTHVAHLHR